MAYSQFSALPNELLMYLRKSRADNPEESVEEILNKHETILQEFCTREFGSPIPEENIYREVVSGESIEDREEIKNVLSRCEDRRIKGIVVVEPQRLSRGDLLDCGKLINSLRFTTTQVVTPVMTYDLENKMERKFFQDELMRGRDYLEYIKDILARGKLASAKRGCFVQAVPPFGYDKVKIGKDFLLSPNKDADTVRLIFDMYVNQLLSCGQIAKKLNEMGVKSAKDKQWYSATIDQIIRNQHYDGKIIYQARRVTTIVENGVQKKKVVPQPEDAVIVVEGKHPAIIEHAIFERAKFIMKNNPRIKPHTDLINPLAGVLRCGHCGRSLLRHIYTQTDDRILCLKKNPPCMKSARYKDAFTATLNVLENIELPALREKIRNGEGSAATIQARQLRRLEKQLDEYLEQEETQYELLETKKYTQALFDRRNQVIREKIVETEKQISLLRKNMPQAINYLEKAEMLECAIEALKDNTIPCTKQNQILKAIVDHIDVKVLDKGKGRTPDFDMHVYLRF